MKKDDPDLRELHLENEELDSVVWLRCSGSLPEQGAAHLARWNRHLEQCLTCSRAVSGRVDEIAALRQILAAGSAERRPDCPSDDIWPLVAAGLDSDPKTRLHAAQCLHCGPLLRKAVSALYAEPTPEEIAAAKALEHPASTTSPIAPAQREPKVTDTRKAKVHSWPVRNWWLALGASAAAIGAVAYFGYQRQVEDPERLLARVYSTHRTVEWRFRGLPASPVRQTRGRQANDSAAATPELLRLQARITEQVAAHPGDFDWLVASGRLNLLLWRYDAALRDFRHASELRPDSTAILSDMAGAYFERGEATDSGSDYGEAVELLGQVLAKQPGDSVALFNRGLAKERLYLFAKAASDWEEALKREPSGAWANEIKTRLEEAKKKLAGH
jgi:cytochrome c-type biogenesis protein CcmH/NrfG